MQKLKQVVLRLVLPFLGMVMAVQLVRFGLVPAIQALFHPTDQVVSIVRRSAIFLLVLLAYWAYVRLYEKRPASELRVTPRGIAIGALSGAALIALSMLSLFALGFYEVTAYRGPQGGLFGVAGLILIAAFLEEVGYRCILFRALESALGTQPAIWLQSMVFAAMHLSNAPASNAELMTTMVSGTLIGAFWTAVFVYSRNLWVATANHAAWNFTIILTGLQLSGIQEWRTLAPFESRYNGPPWLTGGVFGPEDSILTIVLVAVAFVWLMRRAGEKEKRQALAEQAAAPAAGAQATTLVSPAQAGVQ